MGFLGMFFPFIYAWLPVHEAAICLCSFFDHKLQSSWRKYPFLTYDDYLFLESVNSIIYYVFNYLIIVCLVFMVNKIRHINDDTKIKMECSWIVAWWLVISVI